MSYHSSVLSVISFSIYIHSIMIDWLSEWMTDLLYEWLMLYTSYVIDWLIDAWVSID